MNLSMNKKFSLICAGLCCVLLSLSSCESTSMKSKIKDFSDKMDEKNEQRIAANKEKVDKSREAIAKSKEGISPEQEYIIGRSVAAKVLSNYKLYNNKEATKYVNEICTAITSSSDMPTLYNGYVVGILDSKEINAISTPGGHILVTKGLLECASSEDAVAAVFTAAHDKIVNTVPSDGDAASGIGIVSQKVQKIGHAITPFDTSSAAWGRRIHSACSMTLRWSCSGVSPGRTSTAF